MPVTSPGRRSARPIRRQRPSTAWRCSPMPSVLLDGVAAVDEKRGPGDIGRVIRGQEGDRGCHFFRPAEPPCGRRRRGALHVRSAPAPPPPRLGGPGGGGGGPDNPGGPHPPLPRGRGDAPPRGRAGTGRAENPPPP